MKLKSQPIAAALILAAEASIAGTYVQLPTTPQVPVGIVLSSNNQANDQLFIPASSLTLTLLDSMTTPVFYGATQVGSFLDAVYRDPTDGMLVFGGRLALTTFNAETNDMFRSGFTGFSAAAAWSPGSPAGRKPTFVARTATGLKQGALVFSPDVVDFRTDINPSELNPNSGLYLIKTDADSFKIATGAIRLRQGGEEGQPVTQAILAGFVPTTAPVPEPGTWMLLVAGLGLVAAIGRKRLRG
jgi:hypothetical protein